MKILWDATLLCRTRGLLGEFRETLTAARARLWLWVWTVTSEEWTDCVGSYRVCGCIRNVRNTTRVFWRVASESGAGEVCEKPHLLPLPKPLSEGRYNHFRALAISQSSTELRGGSPYSSIFLADYRGSRGAASPVLEVACITTLFSVHHASINQHTLQSRRP